MANEPHKYIECRGIRARTGTIISWGTSVPSDATVGHSPGGLFLHTDGTTSTNVLYCNIGWHSWSNHNAVTIAGD